jgi:drug/metabolite transporter (DMT)-like permease
MAPVLLALLASCQFGAALVVTQFALRHAPPAAGARISILASAALLVAAAFVAMLVAPTGIGIADWRGAAVFAAVGLVFPVAVTRLTFEANRRLGPNLAGALGNLAPLFAVIGALLLLAQVPSPAQAAGLAAIAAGIAAISLARGTNGLWPLAALSLPLAAAAIRGLVQPVTQWGLAFWPSPLSAAAIGYSVSALVVLATVRPTRVSGPALAWFAAVGLCNGGAVLTLYAALAAGPVALVAPLVATYPLVTLALVRLLPGRAPLPPIALAGIAATVAGVMLLLAD